MPTSDTHNTPCQLAKNKKSGVSQLFDTERCSFSRLFRGAYAICPGLMVHSKSREQSSSKSLLTQEK